MRGAVLIVRFHNGPLTKKQVLANFATLTINLHIHMVDLDRNCTDQNNMKFGKASVGRQKLGVI